MNVLTFDLSISKESLSSPELPKSREGTMTEYPVPNPTRVERALFAACTPVKMPLYAVCYILTTTESAARIPMLRESSMQGSEDRG